MQVVDEQHTLPTTQWAGFNRGQESDVENKVLSRLVERETTRATGSRSQEIFMEVEVGLKRYLAQGWGC